MTTKKRIFLAHAREDKPQIRPLYQALKAHGFEPWLDERDLKPGQLWKQEISTAIRDAGVILACLSSQSVDKIGYVQNEFRLALSAYAERPPGSIYLIPLRLDDCEVPDLQIPDRGLSLRDIHWTDLWREDGLDRLIDALPEALRTNAVDEVTRKEAMERQSPRFARQNAKPTTVFRDIDAPWCPEMAVIPSGQFVMGSPEGEEGRADNEGPQREVRISERFAMGRYPVTFEEYDRFTIEVMKRDRAHDNGWGRGRRPVINVSWEDAKAYAAWLSEQTGQPYRLPSEAEWEYACRAGTTTRYWPGDEIAAEYANFGHNVGKTTEVGEYLANGFGLRDMHGNVWEWCADVWHNSYAGAPTDGGVWVQGGEQRRRVLRGGSWDYSPGSLRSANRFGSLTVIRSYDFGFRVARTLRFLPSSL